MTQFALEYGPGPPFDAGTPKKAGKEITKKVLEWMAPMVEMMAWTCIAAAKVMGE